MSLPTLASACGRFTEVLRNCEVTDRRGASLSCDEGIRQLRDLLADHHEERGRVFVIGNGGSAAVASHAVTDFCNGAGLRASTLHDPALLTCLTNDHGHEHAFSKSLLSLALPGDVLIAISSSGMSSNICRAAETMASISGAVVTLSGFGADNPLRGMGELNFWLDSRNYGLVEIGHLFLLHDVADRMAGARGNSND